MDTSSLFKPFAFRASSKKRFEWNATKIISIKARGEWDRERKDVVVESEVKNWWFDLFSLLESSYMVGGMTRDEANGWFIFDEMEVQNNC